MTRRINLRNRRSLRNRINRINLPLRMNPFEGVLEDESETEGKLVDKSEGKSKKADP